MDGLVLAVVVWAVLIAVTGLRWDWRLPGVRRELNNNRRRAR